MPTQISLETAVRRLSAPDVIEAAHRMAQIPFNDYGACRAAYQTVLAAVHRLAGIARLTETLSAETLFAMTPVTLFSAADGELEPIAQVVIPQTDRPAVAILFNSRVFVRGPSATNYEEVLACIGYLPGELHPPNNES